MSKIISEQLYDSNGRPAFKTVAVKQGQAATHNNTIGFESKLVQNRNPANAPSDSFWNGGSGTMGGLIDSWVDKNSFNADDRSYAFSGAYYQKDPESKVGKNSQPGKDFNATSSHTLQYRYGQYNKLPGSSSVSPNNITSILNPLLNEKANEQSKTKYKTSTAHIPLGNALGSLMQVNIQELTGESGVNLSIHSPTDYLLSNSTYTVQPGMGQAGTPIIKKYINHFPNTYDISGNIDSEDTANFYNLTEIDVLGRVTFAQSPDRGAVRTFYDDGGRLRFVQDADQAQTPACLFYLYDDPLGRLTQVQVIKLQDKWNVSELKQYINGTQPSKSHLLRQLTYDILPGSSSIIGVIYKYSRKIGENRKLEYSR